MTRLMVFTQHIVSWDDKPMLLDVVKDGEICSRPLTWKAWLAKPRPSCLHTTMASMVPQLSLHTVPHTREPFLSVSTSTRPSYGLRPPLNRSWGEINRYDFQWLTNNKKHLFYIMSRVTHSIAKAHGRHVTPDRCVFLVATAQGLAVEVALRQWFFKPRALYLIHVDRPNPYSDTDEDLCSGKICTHVSDIVKDICQKWDSNPPRVDCNAAP